MKLFLIISLIYTLSFVLPILIIVAFFTILERKLMALAQRRQGPNVVGLFGSLQAIADGLKLFLKEIIIPQNSNLLIFLLGPILIFFLALLSWVIIPFYSVNFTLYFGSFCSFNFSFLFIYVLSGLSIYGILLSGWSSNSKYSLFGALRSTAQMISYELLFGFIFLILVLFSQSFNLFQIILNQKISSNFLALLPIFCLFLIVILAETNRHPFDLPEAEAELVAGYFTEYSSVTFAFFFLAEYSNMFLMSCLSILLFCNGWLAGFFYLYYFKIILVMCFFIWARIILPRYRYDQLMNMGWKILLPLLFSFFFFYSIVLKIFNIFLYTNTTGNNIYYLIF
jgi:NADH-quinone oxidoreductase subunit H